MNEHRTADFAERKLSLAILAAVLGLVAIGAGLAEAREQTIIGLRGRDAAGLRALVVAQQDPASPQYRRWITAGEFGRRFGAAPRELKRVERWLRAGGCRVKRFTGRQQVTCVDGRPGDVPAALRSLVEDVLDPTAPLTLRFALAQPRSVASDGAFYLSPAEYAAFFGFDRLYAAGIDGSGQRIGIVGVAGVDPANITAFRDFFSLPPLDLEQVGAEPPLPPNSDAQMNAQMEAFLDVTWAGAVAPGAGVVLSLSDGRLVDAIGRLVDRSDVSVISLSVVLIPAPASSPFIRQARRLFRQAATQGKTVLIASGDLGPVLTVSRKGKVTRGVDPMTASPFVTAVGGTTPKAQQSAVAAYSDEEVWQQGPNASGGGPSHMSRPSWQRGRPTRTVPDVSLLAAPVYPIALNGVFDPLNLNLVGGTSAAAPSWAGLVAMLNQQRGAPVGLLNPALYALGRAQAQGGVAVFHDIVLGSNTTTLARGFPAKVGYDLATGWGTPDVPALFAAFP